MKKKLNDSNNAGIIEDITKVSGCNQNNPQSYQSKEKSKAKGLGWLLKQLHYALDEIGEVIKIMMTMMIVLLMMMMMMILYVKKANQRMYLIRKLKTFDVDKKMLEMIYRSLVESILTFNIVTFYGHLTVKQKNRLNKIVNIATKLVNLKQKSLNDLYQQAISKKKQKHYK